MMPIENLLFLFVICVSGRSFNTLPGTGLGSAWGSVRGQPGTVGARSAPNCDAWWGGTREALRGRVAARCARACGDPGTSGRGTKVRNLIHTSCYSLDTKIR